MTTEIPVGITFGKKMLLIPSVSYIFSHSGFLSELHKSASYPWVNRGDPVAVYSISVPKTQIPVLGMFLGEDVHRVQIPSPVSGLLIHTSYGFGEDEHAFRHFEGSSFHPSSICPVRMAILLPDDEPPAECGEYMFSDLRRCCWSNRGPFLRPSRYWSKEAMTEAKLMEYLNRQLELKPHYVDAMPGFEPYFQEARTKYPHLRPYLKHLL